MVVQLCNLRIKTNPRFYTRHHQENNLSLMGKRTGVSLAYRVHMDTVVCFICQRCGVTSRVSILVSGLNL